MGGTLKMTKGRALRDTTEPRFIGVTRRTSLRQALTERCVCRMGGARAPGPPGTASGDNWSEALKWRSHTAPQSVACSVPDVVTSFGVTGDPDRAGHRDREHDTDGGYEHEP
jgi:hypothetical protein